MIDSQILISALGTERFYIPVGSHPIYRGTTRGLGSSQESGVFGPRMIACTSRAICAYAHPEMDHTLQMRATILHSGVRAQWLRCDEKSKRCVGSDADARCPDLCGGASSADPFGSGGYLEPTERTLHGRISYTGHGKSSRRTLLVLIHY